MDWLDLLAIQVLLWWRREQRCKEKTVSVLVTFWLQKERFYFLQKERFLALDKRTIIVGFGVFLFLFFSIFVCEGGPRQDVQTRFAGAKGPGRPVCENPKADGLGGLPLLSSLLTMASPSA